MLQQFEFTLKDLPQKSLKGQQAASFVLLTKTVGKILLFYFSRFLSSRNCVNGFDIFHSSGVLWKSRWKLIKTSCPHWIEKVHKTIWGDARFSFSSLNRQ